MSSSLTARSTALTPEAIAADRSLAALGDELNVLLDVTPVNTETQWEAWRAGRREPDLRYRDLTFDPDSLRRRATEVDIGSVDDPHLRALFTAAARNLELQSQLVLDRGTDRFLDTSIELHGGCSDELFELAADLLRRLEPEPDSVDLATPEEYAIAAESELAHYRARLDRFRASVTVRTDVPSLMVVGRELFVGTDSWIPRHRLEALVHHEVGTHLLTAVTGGHQPLHLLENGTAGYEETQEALGVLSELLVGGMDSARLRVLAGRAVAVRSLTDGAGFVETVEVLEASGFAELAAWTIAMRVHRGGGYTKDVIYLRGLIDLVAHLEEHPIETLLAGRMHLRDVPTIEALMDDGVLVPAVVRPRWLDAPGAQRRLSELPRTELSQWHLL